MLFSSSFFWLADTWWYGMTSRCSFEDFKILVDDRKKKGFTVIQTVVGVPPEVDIYSPHAENSGGLPFVQHHSSPPRFWSSQNDKVELNLKYFDEVDRKIKYLVDAGLVPCIFGGWGHHIDILGVPAIKRLWKEIVKRYAHFPVVLCLCGEADTFPLILGMKEKILKKILSFTPIGFIELVKKVKKSVVKQKITKLEERVKKWNEVARYIKSIDS